MEGLALIRNSEWTRRELGSMVVLGLGVRHSLGVSIALEDHTCPTEAHEECMIKRTTPDECKASPNT
jgi:hypothetical protein